MTEEAFVALAQQRYAELQALNKIDNFYDYEKSFDKIWRDLGREVLEANLSNVAADRRKKNTYQNPLVNVNFTAEKQIAAQGHWLEVLAGGQASVGTEMNSLVVYPMVRIGKMHPYFNGYLSQYGTAKQRGVAKHRGGRVQAYIIIKPEVQLVLSNSLLQGGIFATDTHTVNGMQMSTMPINGLRTLVYQAYYGAVVSLGNFSLSFIQNSSTEWIKNTYSHEFGNVSLWFSW